MKSLLPLSFALAFAACFEPVPDAMCSTDADCALPARCLESRCRVPTGGTGGGLVTAGGTGGIGGGTSGGSMTGGSGGGGGNAAGGDSTGGGAVAGGSAVGGGGSSCGCRTAGGQCVPGDSIFACGAGGVVCQRCGSGEQCANGACVVGSCGPGTCSGCCGRGTCVTPSTQSTIACGQGGAMCMSCPRGQDCVNGTCQASAGCGPVTCAGCCAPVINRCVDFTQQNQFACGIGGAQCGLCAMGQSCSSGVCSSGPVDGGPGPGTCNAQSCPTGCCAFGQCLTGPAVTNFTCGTGGQMCTQCASGTTCQSGVCLAPTQPDGGPVPVLPTGSACNGMSLCEGQCIEQAIGGQPSGFPGGYCTSMCAPNQPCSSGVCITESIGPTAASSCRSTCTGVGQGTCRAGYVCTVAPGLSVSWCRPSCLNPGFGATCPAGRMCQANGSCL